MIIVCGTTRNLITTEHCVFSQKGSGTTSTILIAIVNDELAGFTQMYPIFTSVGMGRALC